MQPLLYYGYVVAMLDKLNQSGPVIGNTFKSTLLKTIVYRGLVIIMDFMAIYLFTGKLKIAVGFMIVSNMYTSFTYFVFERVWGKYTWQKLFHHKRKG